MWHMSCGSEYRLRVGKTHMSERVRVRGLHKIWFCGCQGSRSAGPGSDLQSERATRAIVLRIAGFQIYWSQGQTSLCSIIPYTQQSSFGTNNNASLWGPPCYNINICFILSCLQRPFLLPFILPKFFSE